MEPMTNIENPIVVVEDDLRMKVDNMNAKLSYHHNSEKNQKIRHNILKKYIFNYKLNTYQLSNKGIIIRKNIITFKTA